MKTLDEVITAIEIEADMTSTCQGCSYEGTLGCSEKMHHDALVYLKILRDREYLQNASIVAADQAKKRKSKAPILQVPEEEPRKKPSELKVSLPANWIQMDGFVINPDRVQYVSYVDGHTCVYVGKSKIEKPGNVFGLKE